MIGLLAAASLGLQAGSSLLGAFADLEGGEAAYSASKSNAERLHQQARIQRRMTALNIYRQNQYAESVRGSQVTAIAKSGGSMDDPTSQQILNRTAEEAAVDEWLIRFGGAMEASNLRTQANNALYEGKMAKATGKMGAFTTLLGGAANLFGSYSSMFPGKVK